MYNNEITYNEKFHTKENEKISDKLYKKYLHLSRAPSDCPLAWSQEVLELMQRLDSEIGIHRPVESDFTSLDPALSPFTMHLFPGRAIRRTYGGWWKYTKFKLNPETKRFEHKRYINPLMVLLTPFSFLKHWYESLKVFVDDVCCLMYNHVRKPGITLGQVKEKYGSLRVYYSNSFHVDTAYVEDLIRQTEVKLALKGVYRPLHCLLDSVTTCYQNPGNAFETASLKQTGELVLTTKPFRSAALSVMGAEELQKYEMSLVILDGIKETQST